MAGAEANLKSREPSAADDDNLRLKAKIGELTMEVELLREKATKLEQAGGRPVRRASIAASDQYLF